MYRRDLCARGITERIRYVWVRSHFASNGRFQAWRPCVISINKQTRVLLVDTLSATNDYGVELALALSMRVSLTVFTIETSPLSSVPGLTVISRFPRYGGGRSRLLKSISAVRGTLSLLDALWQHRRDVIHVQFMRFPRLELPLYWLLRPWLRCLIITVHNFLPHEAQAWHRRAYARWYGMANRVHVLSKHIGRQLTEEMAIPESRIDVIPHGNYGGFMRRNADACDIQGFGGNELLDPQTVVISFFGLIRPYKGVIQLARAFATLSTHNIYLIVAGKIEKSAEHEMAEVAQILSGNSRARIIARFLTEHELAALLTCSDIIVFPYTEISQSGALMLAMTYGKAVIANDIEGFREYIRNGDTGLLCDTQDPSVFARQLAHLVVNAAERKRLGESAKLEMDTAYNWDTIAKALVNCYRLSLGKTQVDE